MHSKCQLPLPPIEEGLRLINPYAWVSIDRSTDEPQAQVNVLSLFEPSLTAGAANEALPGGYKVGEKVFFEGETNTLKSGYKLVKGLQGKVAGPATAPGVKGVDLQLLDHKVISVNTKSIRRPRQSELLFSNLHTEIIVSGAGSPEANGVYTRSTEEYRNAPYFVHQDSQLWMYRWESTITAGKLLWYISDKDTIEKNEGDLYRMLGDTDQPKVPPTARAWDVMKDGVSPPPSPRLCDQPPMVARVVDVTDDLNELIRRNSAANLTKGRHPLCAAPLPHVHAHVTCTCTCTTCHVHAHVACACACACDGGEGGGEGGGLGGGGARAAAAMEAA